MDPKSVLQALLSLWDEFPKLLGPAWADLYPRLEDLIARLQATSDPGERASLTADVLLAVREYPAAFNRLRPIIQESSRWRGRTARGRPQSDPTSQGPAFSELLADLRNLVSPATVTRYTDITAPRRLARGTRGVVTVGLTRVPATESDSPQAMEVQVGQRLEVHLHASPEDVEIVGDAVKALTFEADRDSEPVVFYVVGRSIGKKSVMVDFRQFGVIVSTVQLTIEVVEGIATEEQVWAPAGMVAAGGPYAPSCDLDLRVTTQTQDGRTTLQYTLHSPNGAAPFWYQNVTGTTITGSARDYQAHLMEKLEAFGSGEDVGGQVLTAQQIEDKLEAVGHSLYEELFSSEMRTAYRRFRSSVRTLLITSDEPWLPWELIKPYDDTDPDNVIDDDFLCAQFQITRWLAGRGGPHGKVQVVRVVCVEAAQAPGEEPLEYAVSEREYLAGLAQAHIGVEDVSPVPATAEAVGGLLDAGRIGLWHFAAHGNVAFDHPNESEIILADGYRLCPEDIHGRRQTHVARDRPLVFLNACQVGQQSWSLTRLGGWAAAWVDRARCGAFVGPLWEVDDWLAYELASAFYGALREGKTIGAAAHVARQRVRELAADNPTWLAYSFYAHPNARVTFGAGGAA